MTEAEWLTATDPYPMLEFLQGKVSDRKLRLFTVAGCYLNHGGANPVDLIPVFEVVVRYIDGLTDLTEVIGHWRGSEQEWGWPERAFQWASDFVAHSTNRYEDGAEDDYPAGTQLLPLIHDIFGNPFRPVNIDPSWLTSTVVVLASGIYQDRAFDRMPILADALQDAGCDNEGILSHCRGDSTHVRGCWVVDLLLGKT